ncbi:MAG: hypothetical protein PVH04_09270 [Gammaproteobacteria bacterium]|jgi:hypothetical protein
MIGMLMEAVVLAFIIGGIIGAITALQLSNWNLKKIPVKISSETHRRTKTR